MTTPQINSIRMSGSWMVPVYVSSQNILMCSPDGGPRPLNLKMVLTMLKLSEHDLKVTKVQ